MSKRYGDHLLFFLHLIGKAFLFLCTAKNFTILHFKSRLMRRAASLFLPPESDVSSAKIAPQLGFHSAFAAAAR